MDDNGCDSHLTDSLHINIDHSIASGHKVN